ncbi:MAG: response regulator, partial [Sulfuricurvum sp.]|nr:response regulator [Sulfuricurvum sp.]
EEYLKEFNVDFTIVSNGQEALEALENDTYSLILMDINMPVMGGIEATGIIKGKGISTPVVALTANAVSGDQERFLEHGFDGYLAKPIVPKELEKIFEIYLSSHLEREEMIEEEKKIEIPPLAIINIELLKKELDLPDKILHKLLTLFLNSSNSNLLELKKAIDDNDFNVIENMAHKIKGAAGNMRFFPIEELSGEIEMLARSKKNADYKLLYLDFEKLMNTVQEEIKILLTAVEGE